MGHIFVSYSRSDEHYARKLADKLLADGFDVWIDDRIDYGEDWWRRVVQAIRHCDAFIVIMTPASDNSSWVQREVSIADQLRKPVFPLLLCGNANLPDSQHWALNMPAPYVDVRSDSLPQADFIDRLSKVAVCHPNSGTIIDSQFVPLEKSLEDYDDVPIQPVRKSAYYLRFGIPLVISVLLIGLALFALNPILPPSVHTITFGANITNNMFVSLDQQPLLITTIVDTPLAEDQREVRVFLNGIVRIMDNLIDLEDAVIQGALLPTDNRLRAELYDMRSQEPKLLAVAEATEINFQRQLNLTIEDQPETLSGETTFVATLDGNYAVPDHRVVHFVIRSGEGEYQRLLPSSPDLIDGEGRLTIPDIHARAVELFGEGAENLEVLAYIDGSAEDGSDALFVSEPLRITREAGLAGDMVVNAQPTFLPIFDDFCEDAPPPRLKVGASGRVEKGDGNPNNRPSRLRTEPSTDAKLIRELPPGARFVVTRGPVCNLADEPKFYFWEVEVSVGITGWMAEGYLGDDHDEDKYYLEPR